MNPDPDRIRTLSIPTSLAYFTGDKIFFNYILKNEESEEEFYYINKLVFLLNLRKFKLLERAHITSDAAGAQTKLQQTQEYHHSQSSNTLRKTLTRIQTISTGSYSEISHPISFYLSFFLFFFLRFFISLFFSFLPSWQI